MSTRAIVLAILATALLLVLTLVVIDQNRVSRCERYGERVIAFYERQANIEAASGDREISALMLTEALLKEAGYPPPGCQLP